MNWSGKQTGISTILASQGQPQALNKGTKERGVDDGAFVCGPTVSVHPVPVDIAPLAIVATRWKGSDASSIVQLSKVCAMQRE